MGQDLHHSLCQQPSSWAPVDIAHIRAEAPDLAKAKHTAQATKRQEQGEGKSFVLPLSLPQPLCTCLGSGRGHRTSIPTTGITSVQSQACQGAAQTTLTLTASDPCQRRTDMQQPMGMRAVRQHVRPE